MPSTGPGMDETKVAMHRRFLQVNVWDLLKLLRLKLLNKYELNLLKKRGNTDPSAIFFEFDWLRNCPTGEPVKDPEHYQQLILDAFYR